MMDGGSWWYYDCVCSWMYLLGARNSGCQSIIIQFGACLQVALCRFSIARLNAIPCVTIDIIYGYFEGVLIVKDRSFEVRHRSCTRYRWYIGPLGPSCIYA